jgi:hypothetical protein
LKGKRALLPLVFILFIALPSANTDWIKYAENSGSTAGDLLTNPIEEEINRSYEGKYRDGVVDNFDYFINPGYPAGCTRTAVNTGSG